MAKTEQERMDNVKKLIADTNNRRHSVILQDEQQTTEEVDSPWQINTDRQLQQWAKKKPTELLSMINQIRQERDDFREIAIRFDVMWIDKETAIQSEYQAHKLVEQANSTAETWRKRAIDLQKTLNKVNLEANQSEQATEQSPLRSHATTKYEKTSRLPDPPIFTDGLDPTWDDWSSKMEHKLEANIDHYPTEKARLAYLIGRIGGDAAKHTMYRRLRGCSNPYTTAEEILDQLAEIYEDANREENRS